jgi:hypothetical protein
MPRTVQWLLEMRPALKIDEDLPNSVRDQFRAHGYTADSVFDQGWSGLKDQVLWPRVMRERRLFVTADREFGDVRRFPPGTHSGILLFRARKESLMVYGEIAKFVLTRHSMEELVSCVSVVTLNSIRIRRPSM